MLKLKLWAGSQQNVIADTTRLGSWQLQNEAWIAATVTAYLDAVQPVATCPAVSTVRTGLRAGIVCRFDYVSVCAENHDAFNV